MKLHIGIDVGSVSAKLVVIAAKPNLMSLEKLREAVAGTAIKFFSGNSGEELAVLVLPYCRMAGNPAQVVRDLLTTVANTFPQDCEIGLRLTGSGGELIAESLRVSYENEYCSVARGIKTLYPGFRSVIEIGGGTSSYLELQAEPDSRHLGIIDFQTSGDCAAGTGSFLDQQASRLRYRVEEIGEVAGGASCAARVAGRCSVFAKSDMIHAQQRGYTTDQILRGLCDAVARNFKSTIISGRKLPTPVAFIGGVAQNEAVCKALRECLQISEGDLVVPELSCWIGAVGAALADLERPSSFDLAYIGKLARTITPGAAKQWRPLAMNDVLLLRNITNTSSPVRHGSLRQKAYLGIDIGSVSTNFVVINEAGVLLKEIYLPTQGRPIEVVDAGMREIETELAGLIEVCGVGTTGSGRELVGELVGADIVNDEITAHKTGAVHVGEEYGIESVDTIFEIGGQDAKFIRLEKGVVTDFTMNEACAAGTGSFLEEQAEKLGVNIKGEFARLALASRSPARVGERCTVFMERDLTGLLQQGAATDDLCAGLAYSVALNYLNRVVRGRKIGDVIFFQGGTAYNDAVAAAFSQILHKRIIVPPHNGVIGAIGMALAAREQMRNGASTRFRGYNLKEVNFTTRDFTCRACSNFCEMKEFVIEGERSYWGDKCSDKFRKRARTLSAPVIPDLFAIREECLERFLRPARHRGPKVGIPRAMYFYERFPFWCAYLQELGCDVVLSPKTDGKIATAGQSLAVAQPCFPIQVAHGHVRALLDEGVDFVLLPNICDGEGDGRTETQMCPWNQTLPFMVKAAPEFGYDAERILAPTVHFRLDRQSVARQLRMLSETLNCTPKVNERAAAAAFAAQEGFRKELLEHGAKALKQLEKGHEAALVLVGRPYNLYDPTTNCDVPRKLRTIYGVNIIPLDFLPFDAEEISDINPNMYWVSGQRILRAARFTSRYPNLHLLYISNFKCGPDSYIKAFISDAAPRPGLVLQFDGHSNDAGFMTRCEAYLHSKGFL
jgi:predicted CoA-substrate-specific enzyme activase